MTSLYSKPRLTADIFMLQDGLSIICIILRNIDDESIDYDTLIYCYLKVSPDVSLRF